MNQSSVIAGSLLFAFFVFITLKGELPVYAGLLLLTPKTTTPPAQQGNAGASGGNAGGISAGNIVTGALDLLSLAA